MIYLGMDVHKDSITIAVLPASAKMPTRLDKLPNDLPKLQKWIARVARDGEIHACYEASGAGYVLHRALTEWGYACDVIAPSLIPKRAGVQRKHDKRDAADLARLYRAGEIVVIRIPSETDEQMHMISGDVSLQNRDVLGRAKFPDQLSHSLAHHTRQHRPPILRHPHNVQMQFIDRMRAPPVVRFPWVLTMNHLLKPSPEGEGFALPRS
jgi:hypothetical protein